MTQKTLTEMYGRSWYHGNCASAYETIAGIGACGSVDALLEELDQGRLFEDIERCAIAAGLTLGYYASYEHHEVNTDEVELFEAALRFAIAKGLDTHRDHTDGCDEEEIEAEKQPYSTHDESLLKELVGEEG